MAEHGYEFPEEVRLADTPVFAGGVRVALQQCGVCYALVQEDYAQYHLSWHEEEGHLRP